MIAVTLPLPDKRSLERRYRAGRAQYESLLEDLRRDMKAHFRGLEVDPTVKARVKSFSSYYAKLIDRARAVDPGCTQVEIADFLGVRVVCPFIEDLTAVEEQLRAAYHVVEVERKGSEYSVREFGYNSIHYLIQIPHEITRRAGLEDDPVCEVQVRTILQDAWAEVEHELIYKNEFSPFDEPLRRKLAALNANLSLSDIIFQEIRDYQRQLQAELRKRRRGFQDRVAQLRNDDVDRGALNTPTTHSTPTHLDANHKNGNGAGNGIELPSKQEHDENTLEMYQSAIVASGGDSLDNLLLQALLAHNAGDLDRAVELYGRILRHAPKSDTQAVIFVHRGMAQFSRARYDEAVGDFSKTLELDPNNVKALYYRGMVERMLVDMPSHWRILIAALEIDPYQFDGLYARAQLRYELGDYAAAITDCDRALALDPDSAEIGRFRALVADAVGKTL